MSRNRSPVRPILVEFIGPKGSGKTVISEAVAKHLEDRGLSVGRALDARHPRRCEFHAEKAP